jgi:phage tail protein X
VQEVRIIAPSLKLNTTVQMGDGPATITGGLGGWQTVERVDDIDGTSWEGQEPITQDVPLLLDGHPAWDRGAQRVTPRRSVEGELLTLFKLGRDPDGGSPAVFQLEGPIYFPKKHWVLGSGGIDLNTDDTIRGGDGMLVRQSLTLHLTEYVPLIPRKRKKPAIGEAVAVQGLGEAVPVEYTTRQGDTFIAIAGRLYGQWPIWEAIADKNPKFPRNPMTPLPVGVELTLPR